MIGCYTPPEVHHEFHSFQRSDGIARTKEAPIGQIQKERAKTNAERLGKHFGSGSDSAAVVQSSCPGEPCRSLKFAAAAS
ncbi:MAG: hypothetical protein K0B16_13640 [Burkholderiaceae bacterium]|nr:hypothetical protein [Burkholderiaceae bacterium]